MKPIFYFILISIFTFCSKLNFSQSFQYYYPKDNSKLVSLSTNLIFTSDEQIEVSSISNNDIIVNGSISGNHTGKIKLANNDKTILFIPNKQFSPNEKVFVKINSGIKTVLNNVLPSLSFQFSTTSLNQSLKINPLSFIDNGTFAQKLIQQPLMKSKIPVVTSDSIPSDFPKITIGTSNNPGSGNIFMANFAIAPNDSIGNYIMILNNDGSVAKYKKLDQPGFDFKVQPNGEVSYAEVIQMGNGYAQVKWIVMDTSLTPVDTFQCGNGYVADLHDFLLLPNGHAILEAYDPEPMDLSTTVPGGNPNATVIGCVVQELNNSKDVIFQWRSIDYFPVTDSYVPLTTQTVYYFHLNAFDVDSTGDILCSSRHLSTIFKIDRQTGNIDWILGGKENQFTFYNENESNSPNYFSYQHDLRILRNGDITMFDNGNQHSPPYSRAVEYKLDELNKTATMVWNYRHSPDIFGSAMGSVQRESNGNTFNGWGLASATGSPAVTELHPDNSIALEMYLPKGETSYRAYRFPWVSQTPTATVTVYEVLEGNTYSFNNSKDSTGVVIKFNQLNDVLYANANVTKYNYSPLDPRFTTIAPILSKYYFNITGLGISSYNGEVNINLNNFPKLIQPRNTIVYVRPDTGSVFIPVPTSYDSTKNQLIFTTTNFGDFAFGIPQDVSNAYSPVPFSPADSEIVNGESPVNFLWGTRGLVYNYHIQIASDSSFNNIVGDYSNLSNTSLSISTLKNNQRYYWRLNNTNISGTSDWSPISVFYTASPFITLSYPNGGEQIYLDSTYIIRWQANINDTVNIKLVENNNIVSVIGNSIVSATNAYRWHVPATLQQNNNYKIEITDISDSTLTSQSSENFSISKGISAVVSSKEIIKDFELSQNYPNPFNPSTTIRYALPEGSHVKITIYNMIGQEISTIENSYQNAGEYYLTWNAEGLSSGIYFYSISAVGNSGKNFNVVKKMILLK